MTRILDLYCGRGGVGLALGELGAAYIGVDIEDYSDTYTGEFIRGDASEFIGGGFDLVWASPPCTAYADISPSAYGSREAAMDACPTIPELNVREIARSAGDEYVIENVPGASREDHLRSPTRVNGLAFGKRYKMERHFETSFPVPDALGTGHPEITTNSRQSARDRYVPLAKEKGVPPSWGEQGVRSAVPREYVNWILSHAPNVDAPRPDRPQMMLTEVKA